MNEQTLMTIEPKIAQPKEVIVRPELVNPSIVKVFGLNCWLIQATKSNREPFITNEINPKVRMYRGMAITLITGAITAFITPKTAPITSKVRISCHNSAPP